MGDNAKEWFVTVALPFEESGLGDGSFVAALATGERLFLVRAIADILELLGEDEVDEFDSPFDSPEALFQEERPWEGDFGQPDVQQFEAVIDGLIHQDDPIAPTDPALRRLLPDASLDPDVANEFRKYTDDDLREKKAQRLLLLSERLTDVDPSSDDDEHMELFVDADEAEAIAGALGDLRLVLGERLELRSDEDSNLLHDELLEIGELAAAHEEGLVGLEEEQERRYVMGVLFELAGFMQETLTMCMLRELREKRSR